MLLKISIWRLVADITLGNENWTDNQTAGAVKQHKKWHATSTSDKQVVIQQQMSERDVHVVER